MKKVFASLLVGFVLGIAPASACLHFDGELPSGGTASVPAEASIVDKLKAHTPREIWQQIVDERRVVAEKEWDFRTQNNLSVALAHIGQLDEALSRMQTVERTFPGHPYTAYNLATVYELQGNLPLALEWVKKGVQREEKLTGTHRLDGTEWLHIKILEAKIAAQTSPDATQKSVTGLDFGAAKIPEKPRKMPLDVNEKPLSLEHIEKSLFEQLNERLQFVKTPDPVVADLLFDYANLHAIRADENSALALLGFSLEYGGARNGMAQKRFDYFAGTPNYPLIFGVFALMSCAALGWKWNQIQRERAEWKAMPVEELDVVAPPKKPIYIDASNFDPYERSNEK